MIGLSGPIVSGPRVLRAAQSRRFRLVVAATGCASAGDEEQ